MLFHILVYAFVIQLQQNIYTSTKSVGGGVNCFQIAVCEFFYPNILKTPGLGLFLKISHTYSTLMRQIMYRVKGHMYRISVNLYNFENFITHINQIISDQINFIGIKSSRRIVTSHMYAVTQEQSQT